MLSHPHRLGIKDQKGIEESAHGSFLKKTKSLINLKSSTQKILQANLDEYPEVLPEEKIHPGQVLVVGDLHGNPIKLIFLLIRHQFIKMSSQNYNKLLNLYESLNDYTSNIIEAQEDFATLKKMIETIRIDKNKVTTLNHDIRVQNMLMDLSDETEELNTHDENIQKLILEKDELNEAINNNESALEHYNDRLFKEAQQIIDLLKEFQAIVAESFKTCDPQEVGRITFDGDIFFDRGANDFVQRDIFIELFKKKLIKRIAAANHDHCFMFGIKHNDFFWGLTPRYQKSFYAVKFLNDYAENPQYSLQAFAEFIQGEYREKLQLIDYEYDELNNTIYFNQHTPMLNLPRLFAIAQEYKISVDFILKGQAPDKIDPNTIDINLLCELLDKINTKFKEIFFSGEFDKVLLKFKEQIVITPDCPYHHTYMMLWGRIRHRGPALPQKIGNVNVKYSHGHDLVSYQGKEKDYIVCLDDLFGKVYPSEIAFMWPGFNQYVFHVQPDAERLKELTKENIDEEKLIAADSQDACNGNTNNLNNYSSFNMGSTQLFFQNKSNKVDLYPELEFLYALQEKYNQLNQYANERALLQKIQNSYNSSMDLSELIKESLAEAKDDLDPKLIAQLNDHIKAFSSQCAINS